MGQAKDERSIEKDLKNGFRNWIVSIKQALR